MPRFKATSLATVTLGAFLPSTPVVAFSQGSPICEVQQLPLVEMSPVLAQPPPTGWRLEVDRLAYVPGSRIRVRIVNALPKSVRGVLLWARQSPQSGSGEFLFAPAGPWQLIPPPAACSAWSITHRNAQPKAQSELVFDWKAGDASHTLIRAFLIEDCGNTDCRAHQALTPILVLERALHIDGFETSGSTSVPTTLPKRTKQKGGNRRP